MQGDSSGIQPDLSLLQCHEAAAMGAIVGNWLNMVRGCLFHKDICITRACWSIEVCYSIYYYAIAYQLTEHYLALLSCSQGLVLETKA